PIVQRQGNLPVHLPDVVPEYVMRQPNDPIPIASGPAQLRQKMSNADPLIAGEGAMALEWLSHAGVLASFSAEVSPNTRVGVGPSTLSFAGGEIVVDLDQHPAGSSWHDGGHAVAVRGRV